MQKLVKLVEEALSNGIHPVDFDIHPKGGLAYSFAGFSKSGTATLYQVGDVVFAETRYNQVNEIESFDDLVKLSFEWYANYKDRSPFEQPDSHFLPHFIRLGLLKVKTETVTRYEI